MCYSSSSYDCFYDSSNKVMKNKLKRFSDIGRVLKSLNIISTTIDFTEFISIKAERIDL